MDCPFAPGDGLMTFTGTLDYGQDRDELVVTWKDATPLPLWAVTEALGIPWPVPRSLSPSLSSAGLARSRETNAKVGAHVFGFTSGPLSVTIASLPDTPPGQQQASDPAEQKRAPNRSG